MSSKRPRNTKPLSLYEIVDELEQLDDDAPFPRNITILPPDNANADVTDEDSGDEEFVTLNNLPGSQLRAHAEREYMCSESDEDSVPLSSLAKRSRTTEEPLIVEGRQPEPSTSNSAPVISSTSAVPFVDPTVPKTQNYTWRNRHNPHDRPQWQENYGPRHLQTPMYYFDCMFDDSVIELLVKYTNIYAIQKNKVGNVTTSEMKCFLAILLYSGYIVVPRRYMFWEKSSDTDFSIIYNAMSRDRFTFIMTHLHCCDNAQITTESDKFAKLQSKHGVVDRSDQNIGLYRTSIRGKKWYFSLFCHCLDMATHNAWQLYKTNGGEYDHLTFRRTIARGILETYTPRTYRESSRYDRVDHLVEYNDSQLQLRCSLCKKNTNFTCQKCKIHLHPKTCFVTYHTPT